MKIKEILENKDIISWLFILPALLGTLVFIIIPVICSFSLSFTDWNLLSDIHFVGVNNYVAIFKDNFFWQMLVNTFVYAISVSVLGVIIPLILACMLNNKIRGSEFYKTAYFIPFITPMIVIALVWQWIFDPNIGGVNTLLNLHINWLYDKNYAMPVLIGVSVWKLIGYNMIIFLSGLASINQEVLEASKIDGANAFDTFRHVTVPMISSTVFFVIVITSISSFQVFDLIYMMIDLNNPAWKKTESLVFLFYKYSFDQSKKGYGATVVVVLLVVIMILTVIQLIGQKKWVHYE